MLLKIFILAMVRPLQECVAYCDNNINVCFIASSGATTNLIDAQDMCAGEQATVLEIYSQEYQIAVVNAFKYWGLGTQNEFCWLNLKCVNGVFKWLSNDAVAMYTKWNTNQIAYSETTFLISTVYPYNWYVDREVNLTNFHSVLCMKGAPQALSTTTLTSSTTIFLTTPTTTTLTTTTTSKSTSTTTTTTTSKPAPTTTTSTTTTTASTTPTPTTTTTSSATTTTTPTMTSTTTSTATTTTTTTTPTMTSTTKTATTSLTPSRSTTTTTTSKLTPTTTTTTQTSTMTSTTTTTKTATTSLTPSQSTLTSLFNAITSILATTTATISATRYSTYKSPTELASFTNTATDTESVSMASPFFFASNPPKDIITDPSPTQPPFGIEFGIGVGLGGCLLIIAAVVGIVIINRQRKKKKKLSQASTNNDVSPYDDIDAHNTNPSESFYTALTNGQQLNKETLQVVSNARNEPYSENEEINDYDYPYMYDDINSSGVTNFTSNPAHLRRLSEIEYIHPQCRRDELPIENGHPENQAGYSSINNSHSAPLSPESQNFYDQNVRGNTPTDNGKPLNKKPYVNSTSGQKH